jgi:hypothetical protein
MQSSNYIHKYIHTYSRIEKTTAPKKIFIQEMKHVFIKSIKRRLRLTTKLRNNKLLLTMELSARNRIFPGLIRQ